MTKQITLYTSLPPGLTREVAHVETGHSYLTACISSWKKAQFRVVSLNSVHEIQTLAKLDYDVEYEQVPGDRPKIADFLYAIRASGNPVAGIINADVFLVDHPPVLEAVTHHAAGGLVVVRRTNVDPVNLRLAGFYPYGFDAMIFSTQPLSEINLDLDDLFIGHPWWDYWFPLAYAAVGGRLMTTGAPLLFHVDHEQRWRWPEYIRSGGAAIKNLLNFPGQLPQDLVAELRRLSALGAIPLDVLQPFAYFCFDRLMEMVEVIQIPSQPSDRHLLSTLIALLPSVGLFGELKDAQAGMIPLEKYSGYRVAPDRRRSADAIAEAAARVPYLQAMDGSSLAHRLEKFGNGPVRKANPSFASLLLQVAAELVLYDKEGPLNGQAGRQRLFRALMAHFQFDFLVETGTYRGTTAEWIARQFDVDLYTCEIDERLFLQSKKKLADLKNVFVELSDSVEFLKRFVSEHPSDLNVFLYLDAHWLDRLPLPEEIEVIRHHLPKAVVMIDDFEVPNDPGYEFYDYGPGKRIGLPLFAHLRGDWHAFLPTLPSSKETGSRCGVAVFAWDSDVAHRLANVPGLRLVNDSDWAAALRTAVVGPDISTDICEGFIDLLNGAPPRLSRTRIQDFLSVEGWMTISVKEGIVPDAVFVTLTDEHGHKLYKKARRVPRPERQPIF